MTLASDVSRLLDSLVSFGKFRDSLFRHVEGMLAPCLRQHCTQSCIPHSIRPAEYISERFCKRTSHHSEGQAIALLLSACASREAHKRTERPGYKRSEPQ